MLTPQSLSWMHPLDLAARVDERHWVLLYSGVQASYSGRYSYLACDLKECIEGTNFTILERKLSVDRPLFDNAWFGYLGYGLKDCLERLEPDQPNWLSLPPLCMMRFDTVYQFDHALQTLTRWSCRHAELPATVTSHHPYPPIVCKLHSSMSHDEYLEKAAQVIDCIHRGDLYQANLTRKFIGQFEAAPSPFALFRRLCGISPAPYSAYLRLDDTHILSSSPELFLQIDAEGGIRTRPIKGTAPRFPDPAQDERSRAGLVASAKDRAENLMIADLMRNDLSRSCVPGSVKADCLFKVTTHATIHHMSSTVTGRKRQGCSTLDAVRHCFPPGSMTGAPKVAAMRLCSRLEKLERGVYSGAIGWLGGDGSAELSVVIRTLLVQHDRFEFQVGGGIVADSTPQAELDEIIEKSKGICLLLGISPEQLRGV